MEELQKKQAEYDEKCWEINSPDFEKVRHITLHLGKTLGKLSAYCERKDHKAEVSDEQIKDEVIPDLLFHALQLSNVMKVKLDEQYVKRIESNIKRFS